MLKEHDMIEALFIEFEKNRTTGEEFYDSLLNPLEKDQNGNMSIS